jgi:hypothetical protein
MSVKSLIDDLPRSPRPHPERNADDQSDKSHITRTLKEENESDSLDSEQEDQDSQEKSVCLLGQLP